MAYKPFYPKGEDKEFLKRNNKPLQSSTQNKKKTTTIDVPKQNTAKFLIPAWKDTTKSFVKNIAEAPVELTKQMGKNLKAIQDYNEKERKAQAITLKKADELRYKKDLTPEEKKIKKEANIIMSNKIMDVGGTVSPLKPLVSKVGGKILTEAKPIIDNFIPEKYVAEQIKSQVKARAAGEPGFFGKIKNFFSDVKSKLVDSNAPIEDILRKNLKENKITLAPTKDITNNIDRVYRSPVLAGQFARDNGLEAVIKEVDNLDNLDQYMIARQALDVSEAGVKTGRDIIKDKALVDSFTPRYGEYAQKVNQYSRNLLDYSADSGLISKNTAELLKQKYPNYVPLNRIFSEIESGAQFGTKAVASLSSQSVVKTLKGSEREIESPITSLLSKTNDAFNQGEKNKAARLLFSYKDLPNNPFGIQVPLKGAKSPHTISYLDNGVKKTFIVAKEVADAAKALNVQQLGIVARMFALPVRLAKLGITGINVPFVVSNIAKDQVTAFINSNASLRSSIANPSNFIRSLYEVVGHKKLYEEMVRAGGGGTSFDIARNQIAPSIKRIRAGRNPISKIGYTIKHPSELLRLVEDVIGRSEEFTRVQQYIGNKQSLLKQGMSKADAIAGGARAARENTVNFARRGEFGTVLNSTFLYLNASIQGTRVFVRNMKQKPVQTAAKIALTALTPVATATFWNLNDPERAAIYNDIPEFEKQNNLIIIPPGAEKDEDGNWKIWKIPLSQEVNSLVDLVRRPIEQSFGLDPVRASEVASAFLGSVSPVDATKGSMLSTLTPQFIKPTLEYATNQNFFTGFKTVSDTVSKRSPELQYKENTSGTAREIGKLLKKSPLKIEAFIKGTVGSVGSQLVRLSDIALNKLDIIPKDQIHGQKISDAIISRFMRAKSGSTDDDSNDVLTGLIMKQADNKFKLQQEAELVHEELKGLSPEEANAKYKQLKEANPLLFKELKNTITNERLGLSYNDRLINQLNVENGERAKFIHEYAKTLKTDEERNAYIQELRRKRVISDTVMKHIKILIKNEQQ